MEDLTIHGSVPRDHLPVVDGIVVFIAPRAADASTAYAYSSEEQAFEGTPNRGSAAVYPNGRFTVTLTEPPSPYHADFGRALREPSVIIMYMDRTRTLRMSELAIPSSCVTPAKSLAHDPDRTSPTYYAQRARDQLPEVWYGNVRDGARTQEEILRAKSITTRTASQWTQDRRPPSHPPSA